MSTHVDPSPSVSLRDSGQARFHLPAVNALRTSLKKHTAKPYIGGQVLVHVSN